MKQSQGLGIAAGGFMYWDWILSLDYPLAMTSLVFVIA
mgnify:FL=1